jgi:hypothetical protein
MKAQVIIGSTAAAVLLGVGVLAGSVVGADSVVAQSSTNTPTAQATPNASGTVSPSAPAAPGDVPGGGHRGGRGHGDGLRGGDQAATAEGATQRITDATDTIALVKTDLAYAAGKMDTADVQRWVDGAESLLQSAQDANSASQYGQAVAYAQAARELVMLADQQMAKELGANTLPSYSQLPQRGGTGLPSGTSTTVTQAQASRMLANAYERLTNVASTVQGASNASEATPYLTDAQDAYKVAYDAYQAGNYSDAAASARLAERLGGIAGSIARASTAPANADTPVTVPAPNF